MIVDILDILSVFIEPKCELEYNNNFELIIAVMLSAQTTDKAVNKIMKVLIGKYDTPNKLMNASYSDLVDIIKPLGLAKNKARNLIEISKMIVTIYDGNIPNTLEELVKFPGVGRKTANVVLALGFSIPSIAVDTHVMRVSKRLNLVKEVDNVLEIENKLKEIIPREKWIDAHHLLLLFGRYYCKAKNPLCTNCKLKKYCKL